MTRARKAFDRAHAAYIEAVATRDPIHVALSEEAYRAALARIQRQEGHR